MQYREIVAVTGLGGLYQLLGTKGDGAIVRSLADNSTRFISSRQHNVTPLDSIEIYTTGSNVRLHEVLQKMKESGRSLPDVKGSNENIRAYFREVYPDMDEDRVYTSDMKKMVKWFEILKNADLLDFSQAQEQEEEPVVTETPREDSVLKPVEAEAQIAEHAKADDAAATNLFGEVEEAKPAKKARAKKIAGEDEEGEKPAKKATAKKKSAGGDESDAPKKAAKVKKSEAGE
jgi:hypothetical protein